MNNLKYLTCTLFAVFSISAAGATARAQHESCPLDVLDGMVPAQTQRIADACVYFVRIPDSVGSYGTRSFKLLVPDSYLDQAAPRKERMVLDFHGFGSNKANQLSTSCWREKAIGDGFVVAYPNGTGVPTSYSAGDYCCDLTLGYQRDDVVFSRDVVQKVKDLLQAAGQWRVYASGLSNGGALAHYLACEATDLFHGVASVSQTFAKKPHNECIGDGETPIPVIDFRAKNDNVIPYNGGYSWPTLFSQSWLSAAASRAAWEGELGCDSTPPVRKDYGPSASTYCLRMSCETDFVQCSLDAPHVAYTAARNQGLDICDASWEFFGEQSTTLLPQ